MERTKRTKRSQADEAERSGVERSEAERGAEWSGAKRSGAERSGAQAESKVWRHPMSMLTLAGTGSTCCISLPDVGALPIKMVVVRDDTHQHGSGSGRYASTW